jgi:hypothetical protein
VPREPSFQPHIDLVCDMRLQEENPIRDRRPHHTEEDSTMSRQLKTPHQEARS